MTENAQWTSRRVFGRRNDQGVQERRLGRTTDRSVSFQDEREIEADGCVERPRPDTRPEAILTEQDRVIFHRDRENVHFCMRKGGGTMA